MSLAANGPRKRKQPAGRRVVTGDDDGEVAAVPVAKARSRPLHDDIADIRFGFVTSLLMTEGTYLPVCGVYSHHPGLTAKKRAIVVDWLMEVASEYRFRRETYLLAVNVFDRFLSLVRTEVAGKCACSRPPCGRFMAVACMPGAVLSFLYL